MVKEELYQVSYVPYRNQISGVLTVARVTAVWFWPRHQVLFGSDLGSQLHLTLLVQIKCWTWKTHSQVTPEYLNWCIYTTWPWIFNVRNTKWLHSHTSLLHTHMGSTKFTPFETGTSYYIIEMAGRCRPAGHTAYVYELNKVQVWSWTHTNCTRLQVHVGCDRSSRCLEALKTSQATLSGRSWTSW